MKKDNKFKKLCTLLIIVVLTFGVSNFQKNNVQAKTNIKVKRPSITSVTQIDTTTITTKWSKVKDANGYILYYKSSGTKWKKLKTFGKRTRKYTHKNLVAGKKYFYKVKAYKKRKGKKYYSKVSAKVGKKLTNYLLNLYQPYYEYDCDVVLAPASITMGGDIYYNALQMSFRCSAIFNLKAKYSKMSFTAGALGDGHGSISIYADDECVWSYTVNQGDLPKKFTIDIENASKLEIKDEGNHIAGYSLALANIKLYK